MAKVESTTLTQKKTGIFYGWWIVAAGCVVWAFNSMSNSYGMGVFYKRLIDDMGWSRTQLAGAISLSRLESGLLAGVEGFLVDKFGPKPVMLVGVTIMACGLVLLSRVDSLLMFYVVFIGLVVLGNSLSYIIPIDTTVATWFVKRRGTAFGLLRGAVAVGAGGVFILSMFIDYFGWRTAFVATGIGTLLLGIPAAFVMRRRPEAYGLRPDGEVAAEKPLAPALEPGEAAAVDEGDIGMTVKEALRSAAFWTISSGFGLRLMVTTAVTLHAIPLVEDMGYSKSTASAVLGTIGMASLTGRLGGGWLCDFLGTKRVTVVSALTLAGACLVLAFAQSLWMVVLFVAIYAPSYGASVAAMPAIRADYFGRRSFGAIIGLSGMMQTGGSMLGPLFAAYVFDTTGSYRIAFLVFAVLLLISTALFTTLKRPKYR